MNGWWLVSILAPATLLWVRPKWSAIHGLIVLLMAWAAISAAWVPVEADAFDALWKIALGLMLFCIGFEIERIDRFYGLAAAALVPSSLLAISQAWSGQPVTGLFGNPNMMGEAAALIVVALAGQQFWFSLAMLLPALVLSQARGAVLTVLVFLAGHRSVVVVVLACAAAVCLLPMHRGDLLAANSLLERATIWSDTLSQLSFRGHGIGSYQEVLHSSLVARIVEHAHNDVLEIAFELGVPGLVLGAMIAGAIFISAAGNERLVLAAFALEAMFGFPLHAPATAVIGAVVAGHAARGWDDLFWRGMDRQWAF